MLTIKDYSSRRAALMQQMGPSSIIILKAAQTTFRNHYHEYPYRQNSDFWYLTGFNEPDAMAVLAPGREAGQFILFCRERNPAEETWDGARAGLEGAREHYGADEAWPITELKTRLPELLENREIIYYPMGIDHGFDRLITQTLNDMRKKIRTGIQFPDKLADIRPKLHHNRLIKSPNEIELMRKAADISAEGHIRAMQKCKPGLYEYQLEAELTYTFQQQGGRYHAYSPIVGSGPNSCTLHYVTNQSRIQSGDLVLIDAAAEYQNYAADITRTFPANGRFSAEQRAVYEIVLAAQEAGIAAIQPGTSWTAIEENITRILTQGLVDLGLIKGDIDNLIEQRAFTPFYMHRAGHWLGLDVHDAGSYRTPVGWRHLEPGMVRTMEPGLYISATLPDVPSRWHNIGIRIEDDVLVTDTGNEVMSKKAPKSIQAIEELMASSS